MKGNQQSDHISNGQQMSRHSLLLEFNVRKNNNQQL